MPRRALLLLPALASTVLAVAVSEASAATLFTTAAHTTRVTVGATKTMTTTRDLTLTSGATTIMKCTHLTAHTRQDRNDDALILDTVHAGSFGPCNSPITGNYSPPWKITISGTSTTSGGFTRWNAAIHDFSFSLLGGTYTGNLTTGVTVTQPTLTGAPICIHLNAAGSVSGPLTGDMRFDSTLCYTGTAAAYSLT
jgi:hypothetical protein